MYTCLVLRWGKYDSASECLFRLHWLPIVQKIQYKVAVLTFKHLQGQGPKYLGDLLVLKKPKQPGLTSAQDEHLLVIPLTKCKTFAARAFSTAASEIWNNYQKLHAKWTLFLALRGASKSPLPNSFSGCIF